MKKLLSGVFGAAMLPLASIATVAAIAAGQVEGGDIYRVKNVTTSGEFANTASATCDQTVQFKVRIHNPGPDSLSNVAVTATLPAGAATSHTSKVTVSSPDADPSSTSDTATVNLSEAAKLSYVNGSTELLDDDSNKMATLGDTITTTGVKVTGGVGVSIEEKRFVQFKAKVVCEQPEVPEVPEQPEKPEQPEQPEAPKEEAPAVIPATGPASVLSGIVGTASVVTAASYYVASRRNILG